MYNCQRNVVERAMSSSKDVQLSRISLYLKRYEIKDLSVL